MAWRGDINSKARAHDLKKKVSESGAPRRLRCEINTCLFKFVYAQLPHSKELTADLLRGVEDRWGGQGWHCGGNGGKKEGGR
jgi:hypothetical protein